MLFLSVSSSTLTAFICVVFVALFTSTLLFKWYVIETLTWPWSLILATHCTLSALIKLLALLKPFKLYCLTYSTGLLITVCNCSLVLILPIAVAKLASLVTYWIVLVSILGIEITWEMLLDSSK